MTAHLIPTLLPTAVQVLQAFGETPLGQKAIAKGKKYVEVALPVAKKASQLAIDFLATDITDLGHLPSHPQVIKLSETLDIINNGLNLAFSYHENQFKPITQQITDDLDIIKGQNEILFLSHSINYFLESHKARIGIDRGISYALQYDIAAVCNHLKKRKELRFPGYLLHQLTSLAETIKELNVFYVAILNGGHVPHFNEEELKEEFLKGFGIDKRKGDLGAYVPYDIKVKILRDLESVAEERQRSGLISEAGSLLGAFKDRVLTKEVAEAVNDIAHDALFILKEELVASEELEYQVIKKLKVLPGQKLILQAGEDVNLAD